MSAEIELSPLNTPHSFKGIEPEKSVLMGWPLIIFTPPSNLAIAPQQHQGWGAFIVSG